MSPALSSSPSPAWLSQKQAAEALGVTERTIRRLCSDGKLGSRVQPVLGRKPVVMVDQRGVDRILAERVRPMAVVDDEPEKSRDGYKGFVIEAPAASNLPAVQERSFEDGARMMATILKAREVPAPVKPFLALEQAAEYSGLPSRLLARLIREQKLACVRFSGETYVKRADLDALAL